MMSPLDLSLAGITALGGATALRVTVLLLGAMGLGLFLRRGSAAARHALWSITVVAMLVLPVTQWVLPKVPVPVPWRREVPADERLPVATPLRGAAGAPGSRAIVWTPDAITPTDVPGLPAQPRVIPSNREIRGEGADVAAGALSAPGLLFALWAAGALAMALALATGLWSAASLRRGARRVSEPETIAAHERARATAAVSTEVSLFWSEKARSPMAGGIRRPFVVLPESARDWPAEQLEMVLLHELIHVKRRDPLRQLLGRVAFCLYWFHPLAWGAVRTASLAREAACDEAVLTLGQRPSSYARCLLDLAERGNLPLPALARSDPSHLERRITAILRFRAGRRPFRPVYAAWILGGFWALATAAVMPTDRVAPAVSAGSAEGAADLAKSAGERDATGGVSRYGDGSLPAAGDAPRTREMEGDPGAEWLVGATPIVSIGGERSGRIGALVRARPVMLSDGTLVVGHAGEGLLYFNPTGELVKTGGRQGSGPGEIVSNAVRVQRIRGDSVIVMDRAGSRVSVFTADGEFAEYVNTRGDPAPFFIGRLEDGSFLALNSSGYPATRVGEISRDTFHLWHIDYHGNRIRTLGEIPGTEVITTPGLLIASDGLLRTKATVDGRRVYVITGDTYEIGVYDPDHGHVRNIGYPHRPVRYSASDVSRELADQNYAEFLIRERLRNWPDDRNYPAVTDVKTDEDGNIWVEEYAPPGEPTRWRVFASTGAPLATVVMPAGFEPHQLLGNRIVGVEKGGVDGNRVQVRSLTRGPGKL